jgi:8-oxo-dGTP pyrophosphatase MutT (NUDIX family)
MGSDNEARALSVGGVVLREQNGRVETVVLRRGDIWVLPKGTPTTANETLERTALREVREETGLEVRILAGLGQIQYRFTADGQRVAKSVLFYLMRATGGDVALHDGEYDEIRWVGLEDADRLLSFDNYRELLERGAKEWARRSGPEWR